MNVIELAGGLRAIVVAKLRGGLFNQYTLPESDATLATLSLAETLTNKTLTDPVINVTTGYGVKAGSTVAVVESGTGIVRKSVFTFTATPLTVPNLDANVQGIGAKFYDFPEGRILIQGATGSIAAKTTSILADTLNASSVCKWGVGSTVGVSKTLATTEQDIIPVTSITSSATINVAGAVSGAALAASAQLDGTTTAIDAFINFSVPTDDDLDGAATVTLTGTVTITWINLGDY